MVSEVIPVFSRKPLFGRGAMLIALALIGFYGFAVWAHHMFAVGLPFWFNAFMAGASFLIAVPTGIKIFNWLATMWGGALRFTTSMRFAAGMVALFTVGGLTGVSLAVVPFDWQVTDTYYVVAHFHNTLIGGTLMGVMAGLYYWYPKATGRMLSERLGKVHFPLFFFGFLLTFMPLVVVGLLGMPRRVYTWDAGQGWEPWNLASTIGGYVLAAGVLVLIVNIVRSLFAGRRAGDDPWDAWTLEWSTTSPPPHFNFSALPLVRGPRPLWDLKHPDKADWLRGKGHLERRPEGPFPAPQTLALPTPHESAFLSNLPILAAAGLLAVAAGILTSPVVVVLAAIFLLGAFVAWLWEPAPEEALQAEEMEKAEANRLGALGRTILDRLEAAPLAMLAFIGSESVFFGSLIYSYFHLRHRAMVWPPEGMPELEMGVPAVNTVILVTSGLLAHWGMTRLRAGNRHAFRVGIGGAIILGAVFLAGQAYEYATAGFGLGDGLFGTTFFTLTGFHGAHVAGGLLVFALLVARSFGTGPRPRPVEPPGTPKGSGRGGLVGAAEAATYYWHFVDVVWLVVFSSIYLL
jgi:heme/copper-type cytochrome/quinol oxidase subunit 3